ncbi:unnamed protein product, partial [Ixodes pacificus]
HRCFTWLYCFTALSCKSQCDEVWTSYIHSCSTFLPTFTFLSCNDKKHYRSVDELLSHPHVQKLRSLKTTMDLAEKLRRVKRLFDSYLSHAHYHPNLVLKRYTIPADFFPIIFFFCVSCLLQTPA